MKSKAIQRDITPTRSRQPVAGVKLGKVARLRENDPSRRPAESPRRNRFGIFSSNPYGQPRSVSLAWSILIAVLALGVLVVAITFWILPKISGETYSRAAPAEAADSRVRVVSKFQSPSEKDTLSVVKRAIQNRDPELVDTYFHRNGATATEVVEFLKGAASREGEVEEYRWLSSMDSDGRLIEGVLVVAKGQDKKSERLALLTPTDGGVWKVDFDAYARKCTPAWKDLLAEGDVRGVVRVLLVPDSYYNGIYQNEREWDCYALGTPDVDVTLHAYCRSGSAAADTLKKMFRDGLNPARATLSLQRAQGGDTRQFEITEVVAQDWIAR